VPAYVQVSGKTVSGFIAPADGLAFQQDHGPELEFTPFSGSRNHDVFEKPGHHDDRSNPQQRVRQACHRR
jgi:hypothetical protein